MPRSPYAGTAVYNPALKKTMHMVGTAGDGTRAVYSDLVHQIAVQCRANLRNDGQNVLVVEGQPSSGKSTLGIDLALEINPEWNFEQGYVYDADDLKRILRVKSYENVFLFDEATLAVNSKDSMKKESKSIIAILDTLRSRHNTTIFCLPSFDDLNVSIRDRLAQWRLFCYSNHDHPLDDKSIGGRGVFRAYVPKYGMFSRVFWTPVGFGIYRDLTPAQKADYLPIKTAHQDRFIANYVLEEDLK